MVKRRPSLEKALLQIIKKDKGTVMEILNLTNKYHVSVSVVSDTLKSLIAKDQVKKSGKKYVIKGKLRDT